MPCASSVAYLVSFQGFGVLGRHRSLCSIATRLHALQHLGLNLLSCQTLLGAPLSFTCACHIRFPKARLGQRQILLRCAVGHRQIQHLRSGLHHTSTGAPPPAASTCSVPASLVFFMLSNVCCALRDIRNSSWMVLRSLGRFESCASKRTISKHEKAFSRLYKLREKH